MRANAALLEFLLAFLGLHAGHLDVLLVLVVVHVHELGAVS